MVIDSLIRLYNKQTVFFVIALLKGADVYAKK